MTGRDRGRRGQEARSVPHVHAPGREANEHADPEGSVTAGARGAVAQEGTAQEERQGFALGTLLATAIACAFVAPRATPYLLLVVLAGFLWAAAVEGRLATALVRPDRAVMGLVAFLLFASLSAAWAVEPRLTLEKTLLAMLVLLGSIVITRIVRLVSAGPVGARHLSRGVWVGFLIGASFLLFEVLSGCALTLWVVKKLGAEFLVSQRYQELSGGRLAGISPIYLTRNITPVSILLWPALMALRYEGSPPRNRLFAAGLFVLSLVLVMLSPHETSKVAIVVGAVAFALARWSLSWTWRWTAAAWVGACLLVVPLVVLAHDWGLHENTLLPASARHRIVIWKGTAVGTAERPWLGIGAEMTYLVGPEQHLRVPNSSDAEWLNEISRHAHNLYLQTWFELGAVGAVLLSLAGVMVLAGIRRLAPEAQLFAYPTFASAAAVSASSYGMWQTWFIACFGFAVVAFSAVQRRFVAAGESEPGK